MPAFGGDGPNGTEHIYIPTFRLSAAPSLALSLAHAQLSFSPKSATHRRSQSVHRTPPLVVTMYVVSLNALVRVPKDGFRIELPIIYSLIPSFLSQFNVQRCRFKNIVPL